MDGFLRGGAALALSLVTIMATGCARDARTRDARRLLEVRTATETGDLAAMTADLLEARVVYVGEQHDRRDHHDIQLAILRALHAEDPSLAIGMEMFESAFQGALDAWVAGEIDEAELRRSTEYDERWGYDFSLYRPILEFARVHRVPVIALNAPREITRAVARGGLEALGEEDHARLPELVLDDARHRRLVEGALAAHHGMGPELLERFYLVQVIWDESMAASIAEVMQRDDAPRRMVVFAGRMHVQGGLGIPKRAERRGVGPSRIVLPIDADEREELESRTEDHSAADWLWILERARDTSVATNETR